MTSKQILLKMAQLKLDFAKKELDRAKILAKKQALSLEACDEDQLKFDLAQCDVELAELELKESEK